MLFIINGAICLLLFLLIYRKKTKGIVELLSILWLKSIIVVVVLYIVQLALSSYGLFIPINLFTISILLLFNVPGLIGLGVLYQLI